MHGHAAALRAYHRAIRQIRARSRECCCIGTRQRLIGVERALMRLLLEAEAASASASASVRQPQAGWWTRTALRDKERDFSRWDPVLRRHPALGW